MLVLIITSDHVEWSSFKNLVWQCQMSCLLQVIVLWTANTERFCDVSEGLNDTAENLLSSIAGNEEEVSPSTIFAVASILEKVKFDFSCRQSWHSSSTAHWCITVDYLLWLLNSGPDNSSVQCFRQTAPLRESCVAFREGPPKNGKGANLDLYFYKAACRIYPGIVF